MSALNASRLCFVGRKYGTQLKQTLNQSYNVDNRLTIRMFRSHCPRLKKFHLDISSEESINRYLVKLSSSEKQRLRTELDKLSTTADTLQDKPPDGKQLKAVCLFNFVPFVAFGVLDNLIMILAGEYIDVTFGAVLGISTMAAAAWGNLVSDLAGLGTAGYVEHLGSRLGIKAPYMTPFQHDYRTTRIAAAIGRSLGITVGCIIGMFPLLFIDSEEIEKEKQDQLLEQSDEQTEKQ